MSEEVKTESTEVISIEEQIKQQLALQSEKVAQLNAGVNLISFKGGQLIVNGQPVPNGEADVVVLAQQGERAYYEDEFDPSKPQVPTCYSFDGLAPHPEAQDPQHENCEHCPQNKWRTARRGKGKACRESTRVMLVPANVPFKAAPAYQCSFPITSMNSVRDFFGRCANSGKLAPQFRAKLKVVPHPKNFFDASLAIIEPIEHDDMALMIKRVQEARELLCTPYPDLTEPEPEEKPAKSKKY
jgi:hypothetical protein